MRQSKREEALQAAQHVVQREGVTALTYEAVAAESGLTKGGLLYHFPSRTDLLFALHEYVAGLLETSMIDSAGAQAQELDSDARFTAFVDASQYPQRAELLLMLEAAENPETNAVWDAVYNRWVPPAPGRGSIETVACGNTAAGGASAGGASAGSAAENTAGQSAGDGTGSSEEDDVDLNDLDRFIARLAAEGLWLYQSLGEHRLGPGLRNRIAQRISAMGAEASACRTTQDRDAGAG